MSKSLARLLSAADLCITYGAVNYFIIRSKFLALGCGLFIFYNGCTVCVTDGRDLLFGSANLSVTNAAVNDFVISRGKITLLSGLLILLNGSRLGMTESGDLRRSSAELNLAENALYNGIIGSLFGAGGFHAVFLNRLGWHALVLADICNDNIGGSRINGKTGFSISISDISGIRINCNFSYSGWSAFLNLKGKGDKMSGCIKKVSRTAEYNRHFAKRNSNCTVIRFGDGKCLFSIGFKSTCVVIKAYESENTIIEFDICPSPDKSGIFGNFNQNCKFLISRYSGSRSPHCISQFIG